MKALRITKNPECFGSIQNDGMVVGRQAVVYTQAMGGMSKIHEERHP